MTKKQIRRAQLRRVFGNNVVVPALAVSPDDFEIVDPLRWKELLVLLDAADELDEWKKAKR